MTLSLPDELAQQIHRLPERDRFIREALQAAIQRGSAKTTMTSQAPTSQFLVYQAEDGSIKIDVRLEGETVWLPQQQIAELFQTTTANISMHMRNIYAEGELAPEATVKKFLTVRQ